MRQETGNAEQCGPERGKREMWAIVEMLRSWYRRRRRAGRRNQRIEPLVYSPVRHDDHRKNRRHNNARRRRLGSPRDADRCCG